MSETNSVSDVNSAAPAASSNSSPEQNVTGTASVASSAGTLNSDTTHEKSVPYERFKEVNDRLKGFSEKAEIYQHYEQLDRYLMENPEAYDRVKQALMNKQIAQAQAQASQESNDPEWKAPINQLASTVGQMVRGNNVQSYAADFEAMSNDISSPQQKEELAKMVVNEMRRLMNTNDVAGTYRPDVFQAAYQNVRNGLSAFTKPSAENYSQAKAQDGLVPSLKSGGTPPTSSGQKSFGDFSEKRNFALEMFRASRR